MTNDGRDWPRNRETRVSLFSGRSRSVGSFRSAHMESGGNRLSEYFALFSQFYYFSY